MLKTSDIQWLAGLLEGEGCFTERRGIPVISLRMTDKDIIERAREIMAGCNINIEIPRDGRKTIYGTRVSGNKAVQWMLTLHILMGNRRKQKIEEVLKEWKLHTAYIDLTTKQKIEIAKRNQEGENTEALAKEFGRSANYVSQLRRSFYGKYYERRA